MMCASKLWDRCSGRPSQVLTELLRSFEISGLSPGTYSVTAVRAGFAVYEETLEVDGTRRELPIELPLSPFTQFVETVSRVVEEQAEAPFLVTQVQAEELRETAAVTLDEALRTVSGLQHATQGNAYTRVATRGFRDTRDVLVLLDGAPFRQLSGSADLTMIPVSTLQGVEFVKGSTSSVYGRGGVAGTMQFFTVPEATPTPSGEVVYGVGSFNTHEGQASVNLPYSGGRFAASGSASRSDLHQDNTGQDTTFLTLVNDYAFTPQANLRLHYLLSDVEAVRGSIIPLEDGRPMFEITRVPHPVSWTHVCATRHGVARIPRAFRAACDTPASRGASTGCSVRRTQRRPRAPRRGFERPGRRRLAP